MGEFVAKVSSVKVDKYLKNGRIAWDGILDGFYFKC